MAKTLKNKDKKAGKKLRNLQQLIEALSGPVTKESLIAAIEAGAAAAVAQLKAAPAEPPKADEAKDKPKKKAKKKDKAKTSKNGSSAVSPDDIADSHE